MKSHRFIALLDALAHRIFAFATSAKRPNGSFGSNSEVPRFAQHVRYFLDCVKKLEDRGASKISQMMHVGISVAARLCRIDTRASGRFCGN
jgi:hypothetical protein